MIDMQQFHLVMYLWVPQFMPSLHQPSGVHPGNMAPRSYVIRSQDGEKVHRNRSDLSLASAQPPPPRYYYGVTARSTSPDP